LPSRPPDDEFDKDAYRVLRLARGLRKRFAEGDVRGAIIHAFELGMIVQRMNARWAERFAHSGRKGGLKTSIKARDMKRLKASERRAEIRRMVEAEIKRQPGLQRARLVVAKRIDAASLPEDDRNERHTPKCWSTVVRATKGMKKISK
jgi:DNA invertase Pin-like site-specific DNA recombinase